MTACKCFVATQIDNGRVFIDQPHGVNGLNGRYSGGLAAQLGKHDQEETGHECEYQQCVIAGKF